MTQRTYETRGGGIGFLGALTIAFIVLKLTGVIGWSWWWVLAPLYIPWVLFGIGLLAFFVVWAVNRVAVNRRKAKRQAEIRARRGGL